ncbi:putative membrane protein [Rhodococcus sp. AG1013]|uniref:anthrone oxygenase family protein n=1 Tax=Rhodococcus sp. AG1013 TaxID=2183996 RepID=UPI000E0B26BB|nr:anthrone oxygenase family protein [Rhodococcus sp. AG1013]RDI18503.1 putative membrane protein [Rhodococcus sp. AG1013]
MTTTADSTSSSGAVAFEILVGVTALGAVIAGGALFAFSAFVMPALSSIPVPSAIESMQAINVAAPRSALMVPLMGSALTAAVCGVWAVIARPAGWVLVLVGVVGTIAAFAVTAIYHVPRNDAFASADLADAAAWQSYRTGWTLWNHVRVGVYFASGVVLAIAAALPATRSADAAL